jgi:hypothetical protein
VGSKLHGKTNASDQVDYLNSVKITEIALISTVNPWSGNRLVNQTKPIKSIVTSKTIPQITKATLIYWMMVTARKTTAMPNSMFSIATERMYPYWS